jgi:hypothetical protein
MQDAIIAAWIGFAGTIAGSLLAVFGSRRRKPKSPRAQKVEIAASNPPIPDDKPRIDPPDPKALASSPQRIARRPRRTRIVFTETSSLQIRGKKIGEHRETDLLVAVDSFTKDSAGVPVVSFRYTPEDGEQKEVTARHGDQFGYRHQNGDCKLVVTDIDWANDVVTFQVRWTRTV